ncbi:BON domain-containing protein, partial [Escherichia sp. HC-CC]
GRDDIVRQQFGFDFTGGGGVTRVALHVKVETTDGVVQLSGTVDSQAQSDRAESIAKAVDGVKSVKNDLKTK